MNIALRDDGNLIKDALFDRGLKHVWLINQLEAVGICVTKTELADFLAGRRDTPKAIRVLSEAKTLIKNHDSLFASPVKKAR